MSTADETARCACCRARPTPGYLTCTRCTDRLREHLADVAEFWPMVISADLAPQKEPGRRAPGFHSNPPIDVGRVAILDPRLYAEGPGDLRFPPDVIFTWADELAADLGQDRRAYFLDAARALSRNLAHITRQPWVADMAREVGEVARQLANTVGVSKRRFVGLCPTVVDETTCRSRLYAPLAGDVIHCLPCDSSWDRLQWAWLGTMIEAAA